KGKSGPVAAFRLLGVRPDVPGQARPLDGPMVGRDAELGLRVGATRDAVAARGCHLAVVAGAAGVGKSRLVKEFQATVSGQATVLHRRCPQYGEGLTSLPVAEVIRQAAASGGPAGLHGLLAGQERAALVVDELAGVAGTAEPTVSREGVPWAVRHAVQARAPPPAPLARGGPVGGPQAVRGACPPPSPRGRP